MGEGVKEECSKQKKTKEKTSTLFLIGASLRSPSSPAAAG
jgi:hypothetical protein